MLADLRIALRTLTKSPGFTAVTVVTLALGIGASTALFSIINALLYRPLPLRNLDALVFAIPRENGEPFLAAPAEYEAWRDHARSFTSWGAAISGNTVLTGRGDPEQLGLASIDAGYLSTLGVQPLHGRTFTPEEFAADAPVALLSHSFWQGRFAGDTAVLGQSVVLDGTPHTIVGILPPGVDLPRSNQVYRPYRVPAPGTRARLDRGIFPVARLVDGVALAPADAELKGISARLAQTEPSQKGWSVNLIPLRRQLLLDINGELDARLLLLASAVGVLLLVACANVGNLMLARALDRQREFAVCAALGANRGRILRRLFAESTVLAVFGGLGGIALAIWLTPLLIALSPVETVALSPLLQTVSLDGRVLALATAAILVTLVLTGLPAFLNATRVDLVRVLQSGGSRGSAASGRWRDALVVAEIALCLTLLASAALLGKSLFRLLDEPLGFDPRHVLSVRVAPSPERYPDQAARHRFASAVLERVRALPGVQTAGVVTTLPFHLDGWSAMIQPETGPRAADEQPTSTVHRLVLPGYFETMGMRLVRGRFLDQHDGAESERVAVVTETFAERFWPGENPLGKRVRRSRAPDQWLTVVGVVAPVKEDRTIGLRAVAPVWYLPYAQMSFADPFHIVVRSEGDPALLGSAIAGAIHAVDPLQPAFETVALEPYIAAFLAPERFAATLVTGFAALGLLLAGLGVYGVCAYIVATRQRELGIRLALGATPAGARTLIYRRSFQLFAVGTVLGLAAALVLGRLFGSLLHGVDPQDPAVLASVVAVLAAATAIATWLPARRATQIDPLIALKAE